MSDFVLNDTNDDSDEEEDGEEDIDVEAHSKGRVRPRKRLRRPDAAGRGEGGSLAENIAACRFSDHEEEDYLESDEGTAGKRRQLVSQTKLWYYLIHVFVHSRHRLVPGI